MAIFYIGLEGPLKQLSDAVQRNTTSVLALGSVASNRGGGIVVAMAVDETEVASRLAVCFRRLVDSFQGSLDYRCEHLDVKIKYIYIHRYRDIHIYIKTSSPSLTPLVRPN